MGVQLARNFPGKFAPSRGNFKIYFVYELAIKVQRTSVTVVLVVGAF